jgi:hypothetical protein
MAKDKDPAELSKFAQIVNSVTLLGVFGIGGYTVVRVVDAFEPIARDIAGQTTDFNFNMGLEVSIGLNVVLGGAAAAAEVGRRRTRRRLTEMEAQRRKPKNGNK